MTLQERIEAIKAILNKSLTAEWWKLAEISRIVYAAPKKRQRRTEP